MIITKREWSLCRSCPQMTSTHRTFWRQWSVFRTRTRVFVGYLTMSHSNTSWLAWENCTWRFTPRGWKGPVYPFRSINTKHNSFFEFSRLTISREYSCPVTLGQPKVAFRETILPGTYHFDYLHKRQSGGRGQYGRAIGTVELNPASNTENVYHDKLKGTNLSRGYVKPITQGMQEVFEAGSLIGEPIVGMEIKVIDGAEHKSVILLINR